MGAAQQLQHRRGLPLPLPLPQQRGARFKATSVRGEQVGVGAARLGSGESCLWWAIEGFWKQQHQAIRNPQIRPASSVIRVPATEEPKRP
jgi:hypothetical protein